MARVLDGLGDEDRYLASKNPDPLTRHVMRLWKREGMKKVGWMTMGIEWTLPKECFGRYELP